MTDTLKPCPFCGDDFIFLCDSTCGVVHCQSEHSGRGAHCDNCMASGPCSASDDEAIATWDRRVDGWIPVSERLPEDGESSPSWAYLCIHEKVGLPFLADYVPGLGWKTYRVVTHWQPIDPISRSDDA